MLASLPSKAATCVCKALVDEIFAPLFIADAAWAMACRMPGVGWVTVYCRDRSWSMVSCVAVMIMHAHTINADMSDSGNRLCITSPHAESPPPHRSRSRGLRRLSSTRHSRAALCWLRAARGS